MKNYLSSFIALLLICTMISCAQKEDLCSLPEADNALKEAMIERMKRWQDNAKYAQIDNFESRINQVINDLSIIENEYHPGKTEESTCHCKARIQFKDHENFLAAITEPVEKVKAEKHPLDSPYLAMRKKINYVENDGFQFFFTLKKVEDGTLKALQNYYLPLEPQMDTAGGMIWEYFEYYRIK